MHRLVPSASCASAFFACIAAFGCGGATNFDASDALADDAADAAANDRVDAPAETMANDTSVAAQDAPPIEPPDASEAPIDPIAVGHTWTYDVKVLGNYPLCADGTYDSPTLRSYALAGKTALEVKSLCKNAPHFLYAVEGDRVFTYDGARWVLSLDAPVVDGHRWTNGVEWFAWKSVPSVTTSAGTFAGCWSARADVAWDDYTTFCRGVGPVHWHHEDGRGNGYDAVLTKTNF